MMQIKVDASEILGFWKNLESDQMPFAISKAMNDVGFDTMRFYKSALPGIIDRPTPFTIRAMFVEKASKKNLSVKIGFKESASKGTPAAKYMHHLNEGGTRPWKRSEVLLRQKGYIQDDQQLIPSKEFMNQYGNARESQVVKMLSAMQATFEPGNYSHKTNSRNKTGKLNEFFVNSKKSQSHFGPHVYRKSGRHKMKLFMWVTKRAQYKKILNYNELTSEHFAKQFPDAMQKAFDYAMATRKI
jgi:hypothetical protein